MSGIRDTKRILYLRNTLQRFICRQLHSSRNPSQVSPSTLFQLFPPRRTSVPLIPRGEICCSGKLLQSPACVHHQHFLLFSSSPDTMGENIKVSYHPPSWAAALANAPAQKLQLAMLPTPIRRWHLPGVPEGFEVYIKRDDLTGSTLSGNKVRKLEFLLADALAKGCRHVITCGAAQSNHCRATAVACAELGLKAHLFFRTDLEDVPKVGNVLIDEMCGAELYVIPRKSPYVTACYPRMVALSASIEQATGEKCYLIPVGGSDEIGIWGYLQAFNEMIQQGVPDKYDDIVFACGSGGTAEGLALGNYLSESGMKVHGVAVSDDKAYFDGHLNEILDHFNIRHIRSGDILDTIEGHKGRGYGLAEEKGLEFITKVSQQTGIMLDPVYSGKAAYGLVQELQQNPGRFKGKKILFIHTGGLLGMGDGQLSDWLKSDTSAVKRWHTWPNITDPVPTV